MTARLPKFLERFYETVRAEDRIFEKYPDTKFGAAAYISLKLKYMMKYGELAETDEKGFAHLFYAGLGFHFW